MRVVTRHGPSSLIVFTRPFPGPVRLLMAASRVTYVRDEGWTGEACHVSGYSIIAEGSNGSFSAYSPDVPGCGAAADSRAEVEALIREAIEFHIEGLVADGDPVPEPSPEPYIKYVECP